MPARKGRLEKEGQHARARSALEAEEARELGKPCLVLRLFFEWPDGAYGSRAEMELALKRRAPIARRTGAPEVSPVARATRQRTPCILSAWERGPANAVAESLSRQVKDAVRECRGFMGFAALRRRCLLVLGREGKPDKPISPLERSGKRREGGQQAETSG